MAYYRPKAAEETYKFAQCFGDKNDHAEVNDGIIRRVFTTLLTTAIFRALLSAADVISAISFDKTGDFLASGDRAGRVVLFERNRSVRDCCGVWSNRVALETIL